MKYNILKCTFDILLFCEINFQQMSFDFCYKIVYIIWINKLKIFYACLITKSIVTDNLLI
jgi:hypothetical protein